MLCSPLNLSKARKYVGTGLAVANKINSYVGEYTENVITQRKINIGLTLAGIGLISTKNPIAGAIALAVYVGDKGISYGINVYKQNLNANYLKELSNGTVKTGR